MEKCNACGRVGDDIGTCGSFVTCPKVGVPVEPTDIVLHCAREGCGFTRVVAAGRIMQGKSLSAIPACPIDECEARAVFRDPPRVVPETFQPDAALTGPSGVAPVPCAPPLPTEPATTRKPRKGS